MIQRTVQNTHPHASTQPEQYKNVEFIDTVHQIDIFFQNYIIFYLTQWKQNNYSEKHMLYDIDYKLF